MIHEIELKGVKADQCFTEDSYVVLRLTTFKEKAAMAEKFKKAEKDPVEVFSLISSFVVEVCAKPVDEVETTITDFDEIGYYSDSSTIAEYLVGVIGNGFSPKKI